MATPRSSDYLSLPPRIRCPTVYILGNLHFGQRRDGRDPPAVAAVSRRAFALNY